MAYNKLIAAVLSGLLTRWLLQYFQIDVAALGVGDDFKEAVSLAIDAVAAGIPGFFVWLIPNVRKEWDAIEQRWKKVWL